jgi:diguanylate cyclase (GGDEF)-like protein
LQLAERLRVAIEELHIPLCGDEGADQLRVTISIGVATQARQESWEQLLERADQALYSAKNKGRNQVQLA